MDEARELFDVAVIGGGPTGMTAALALAASGMRVALVAPPAGADPRTTALLAGSVDLLASLGVWPHAEAAAAPLRTMRIVDATGRLVRAPEAVFNAVEAGAESFGFNIPNDALNAALSLTIAATANIARVAARAETVVPGAARVAIDAGPRLLAASLVVAADGAASATREAAGIAVRSWQYRQTALVTTLSHSAPHHDASTEFHTPAGPFTLVPLPGRRSSLVWVERPEVAERLAALDDAALSAAIERQAHSILGAMTVDGPRGLLPLAGHVATRFADRRVALVGETAHRFPPIGAQGLNLGLRDVAVLARTVARTSSDDPGDDAVLAAYDRARRGDVVMRTAAVDLFDRSLLTGFLPVQVARAAGLYLAGRVGPIRRFAMRQGLGPATPLVGWH
jgi:2-octaprenyl-6-methoxyphenol hydroxylase